MLIPLTIIAALADYEEKSALYSALLIKISISGRYKNENNFKKNNDHAVRGCHGSSDGAERVCV